MVSRKVKLRIEAPVNGGRNYEQDTAHDTRRERNCSSVNKLGYMLESLSIFSYEGEVGKIRLSSALSAVNLTAD